MLLQGPDVILAADGPVKVTDSDGKISIEIDGKPFTQYIYQGHNKPVLYPIYGPGQTPMTRSFPFEKRDGEANDHPHHESMWFTHGKVNGEDFWLNRGKIVQTEVVEAASGEVGRIKTNNEWRGKDGKVVCTDSRVLEFAETPAGRVIDWEVTIHASHGDVVLGDTKEGTMGIRTRPELRLSADPGRGVKDVSGQAVNSEGVEGNAMWGKRAKWVDYHGQIDGKTVGIAIFDHPKNLRHPTWWHARNYGLVAANPFGMHDFDRSLGEKGDYTIPAGESLTFRYRFLFHPGTTEEAKIEEAYQDYAK
ncbi:MAG: PmoA family protein [Pirellulales bacterium]